MAIIVVDNVYLQAAARGGKSRSLQRLKQQLRAMLSVRNKYNRSPFPDRVWARHSALLTAARASGRERVGG